MRLMQDQAAEVVRFVEITLAQHRELLERHDWEADAKLANRLIASALQDLQSPFRPNHSKLAAWGDEDTSIACVVARDAKGILTVKIEFTRSLGLLSLTPLADQ